MIIIATPATSAENSLGSPPAAVPNLDATAPGATAPYSPAITSLARDIDEARANLRRGKDMRAMVEFGRRLLQIKAMVPHGQFGKVIRESIKMDDSIARKMMRIAREAGTKDFLSLKLSRTAMAELLPLGEDTLKALADGQTRHGYVFQDFRGMTAPQVRKAVSVIMSEDMAQTATSAILRLGDRVKSRHAGRLGEVVRVYNDGSACICWDDGEPQEAGLGHERMPRELLKKVAVIDAAPAAAPTTADAPEVDQIEVHAPPPQPADPPPPAEAQPGRPAVQPAARPSMAEREEYCEALFSLLFGHADDAGIDMLCDEFEAMLDVMSNKRPRSAVARRWKALFERHCYEGGV